MVREVRDFRAEVPKRGAIQIGKIRHALAGGGGLLADDEPLHARARKMSSTDNGMQVRYEGDAVAWQSANRLQADVIEIDREQDIVKAHGRVVSQLLDRETLSQRRPKNPRSRRPVRLSPS